MIGPAGDRPPSGMSTKPKPRPRAPTIHEASSNAADALVYALGSTVAAHLGAMLLFGAGAFTLGGPTIHGKPADVRRATAAVEALLKATQPARPARKRAA